ncbi:MAG: FadR family transcriptional regulator [Desulfohalobiaceae bacterium]|nr:FadR family transcriptional regulator [Desulfohalobiaceae bacterium]
MVENKFPKNKIQHPVRLSDQIADLIKSEIDKGTYRPGDMLPPETNLGKNFGVSRTVIREALGRLKYDGLLESRQGLGVSVAKNNERRVFRFQETTKNDPIDLGHLFELRSIVESGAASLAAMRRTKPQLDELKTCLEQMQQAVENQVQDGVTPDHTFHQIISAAGANPYLLDFMQFLNTKIKEVIKKARDHSSGSPGLSEVAQQEHEAIYRALLSGNSEEAGRAMATHIHNASQRLGLSIMDTL